MIGPTRNPARHGRDLAAIERNDLATFAPVFARFPRRPSGQALAGLADHPFLDDRVALEPRPASRPRGAGSSHRRPKIGTTRKWPAADARRPPRSRAILRRLPPGEPGSDGLAVAPSWHLASPQSQPHGDPAGRGACRGATPMVSKAELWTLARRTLDARTIPNRPPERTSNEPGIGAPCVVCQVPIAPAEEAVGLQYVRDERYPEVDTFHAHLRCAAVLELVRDQPVPAQAGRQASEGGEADEAHKVTVSRSVTGRSAGERRPFTLSGPITWWSHGTRELSILDRNVQLAPHVPLLGVELGVSIVVAGYHDPLTSQMVVTRLLLV